MNEELQKALAELLGKANNGIDTAGEFLASELPDVIQQLLMWHGVKSLIFCVTGILMICFAAKAFKSIKTIIPNRPTEDNSCGNWFYERYFGDSSSIHLGGVVFCLVFFNICFTYVLSAIYMLNIQWLQIWIAPKVWLIEYAAKLAN